MDSDSLLFLILTIVLIFITAVIVAFVLLAKKSKERGEQAELRVTQIAQNIPSGQQGTFMMQYQNVRKDPTTAVLLALLLGGVGAHKFYLGQVGLGVVYILFSWTFIPAIVGFIEAFSIAAKVGEYNEQKAIQLASILR